MTLVSSLISFVSHHYYEGDKGLILYDYPGVDARSKPPKINGFIPDLFALDHKRNMLVIGEAKTAQDLERSHTVSQIDAFLRECSTHSNGILVMAVPWDMVPFTRNLLNDMKNSLEECRAETVVLEKLVI